ncbi:hypothetical protein [Bordetella sp. BOR01]|uniref:hypothetical protein n=1 Tax=Bordetella sp. BOR01 TaxID=2854779 RepID=UPI001C474377|nr:hypothetical protein [Bordetella sp. BOR01]MBV7482510.1 hypothetical protein [Bordetella sp. BOR01]
MEYTFTVYSRRWNHTDTYRFTKTSTGWNIQHMAHSGPCDREGSPHLIGNFDQDYISYPNRVEGFIGFIWDKLNAEEIDGTQAQEMLQQVADWVSNCERSQPEWPEWNSSAHR